MVIVCYECKGKVSDSAESCPHCGSKNYAHEHNTIQKKISKEKVEIDAKIKGFKSVEAMREFEHKQKKQLLYDKRITDAKKKKREKIAKRKQSKIEKQKEKAKDLKVVVGVFFGFIVICIVVYLLTMKITDFFTN